MKRAAYKYRRTKSRTRKRKHKSSKSKNYNFSVKTLGNSGTSTSNLHPTESNYGTSTSNLHSTESNLESSESDLPPLEPSLGTVKSNSPQLEATLGTVKSSFGQSESNESAVRSEVMNNFNLKHLEETYYHYYTGLEIQNSHTNTNSHRNIGGLNLRASKFGVSTKLRGSRFGVERPDSVDSVDSSQASTLLNDVWFAEFNFPVDLDTFKDIITDAAKTLRENGPVSKVKKTFKSTIFDPEIGQHITHIRRSSADSITSVRSIRRKSQDLNSHLTPMDQGTTIHSTLDTVDTNLSSAVTPEFKPYGDSINYYPGTDDKYYPVTKITRFNRRNSIQPENRINYQINDPNSQIPDYNIINSDTMSSNTINSDSLMSPGTINSDSLMSPGTINSDTMSPITLNAGSDTLIPSGRRYKSERMYNYVEPRVKDLSYLKSDGFKEVLARCPFLNGPNMDNKIATEKSRTIIKKLLKQSNEKHYEDHKYYFQPFIGTRRGRCENEILEGVNRSLYQRFTSSDRRKLCKSLMPKIYKKLKNLNYLQHSDKKTLLKRMNMAIDNYLSICLSKKKYEFIYGDEHPLVEEHLHTCGVYDGGGVIPWRMKYVTGEPFQLLNFTNHATNIGQIIKQIIN